MLVGLLYHKRNLDWRIFWILNEWIYIYIYIYNSIKLTSSFIVLWMVMRTIVALWCHENPMVLNLMRWICLSLSSISKKYCTYFNTMFYTCWKSPMKNWKNMISYVWYDKYGISILVSVTCEFCEGFSLINGLQIFQRRNKSYHECSDVMIQRHRDKLGLNPALDCSQSRDASRAILESQVDDGNSLTRSTAENCTKTEWIRIVKLLHAVCTVLGLIRS